MGILSARFDTAVCQAKRAAKGIGESAEDAG